MINVIILRQLVLFVELVVTIASIILSVTINSTHIALNPKLLRYLVANPINLLPMRLDIQVVQILLLSSMEGLGLRVQGLGFRA